MVSCDKRFNPFTMITHPVHSTSRVDSAGKAPFSDLSTDALYVKFKDDIAILDPVDRSSRSGESSDGLRRAENRRRTWEGGYTFGNHCMREVRRGVRVV